MGSGDIYDAAGTGSGRLRLRVRCQLASHMPKLIILSPESCLYQVVIPTPLLCQFRHSPIVRHGMQTRGRGFQFIGMGLVSTGSDWDLIFILFFRPESKLQMCKLLQGCFEASPKRFSFFFFFNQVGGITPRLDPSRLTSIQPRAIV